MEKEKVCPWMLRSWREVWEGVYYYIKLLLCFEGASC